MNLAYFKDIFDRYVHRDRSKLYITPYRDWGIILISSAFLFVAFSAFGYYAYDHYYVAGVESTAAVDAVQKHSDIDVLKKDLDSTFAYFNEKEKKHQTLLLEKRHFDTVVSSTTKSVVGTTSNPVVGKPAR